MALLVNLQIDPKKTPPVTPAMFNPYSATDANREHIADTNDRSKAIIDAEIAKLKALPVPS